MALLLQFISLSLNQISHDLLFLSEQIYRLRTAPSRKRLSSLARKNGIMVDSTTKTNNRREYSRVDVYIPLECRLLEKEERGLVSSRLAVDVMLADFKLLPPLANHPRFQSLAQLNDKLDTIIKIVGLQCEGFHALPFKFVSLGGNGMKFSSLERYSVGDVLECKMILTLQQSTAIYIYGEVVRVTSQGNGYFANVSFTSIDERIRDKIVRFVFETEREMIRQRNKEAS
jgi:hypothetical protein